MRIMITGAEGMLGYSVMCAGEVAGHFIMPLNHDDADIRDYTTMRNLVKDNKPDALINCAGITPEKHKDGNDYYDVNSVGPRLLANLCSVHDVHMVHISTDCVFSGLSGAPYTESSREFSKDDYGKSKLIGELDNNHLTIRCSFIGLDGGLLKWLLNQEGNVPGFVNVHWNGMSVKKAAEEIIYQASIETKGLLHIYGQDTTKYKVLHAANEVFGLGLNIIASEEPKIDRRLRTNRKEFTMALPSIREQLEELL